MLKGIEKLKIPYAIQIFGSKSETMKEAAKIIERLDLRVKEELIDNNDLKRIISYDKEMFNYIDMDKLPHFVLYKKTEK